MTGVQTCALPICFPRLHVADAVGDLAVLLLGCVEALTQVVEAFLVLGLIEC